MSESMWIPMTMDDVPYLDEAISNALFGDRQTICSGAEYQKIRDVEKAIIDAGFRFYVEVVSPPDHQETSDD